MQHVVRTTLVFSGVLLVGVLVSACTGLPDILMQGAATAQPTDVAAQRPEAALTIGQPPPGATLASGRISVAVNYKGPPLVPTATATELNQYHLNYLLDVSATPYLHASVPIPLGNASIIHTSNTQVSFENVAPGNHLLAVILTGSNDVSPSPPVAQQISFTTKEPDR